jgi:hypothetical protein
MSIWNCTYCVFQRELNIFSGSAGTAIDTHRNEQPSSLPAPASAALHNLSRPKTVRHTLITPRVHSSRSALKQIGSISTNASGSFSPHAVEFFESPVSQTTHAAAGERRIRKSDSTKSELKSIEMKGDRYCLRNHNNCCFYAQTRNNCRLLSWLRQANEVEGGGITPIARFRLQLQVSSSCQVYAVVMTSHIVGPRIIIRA